MQLSHDAIVDRQFGPRAQAYVTSAVHSGGPDLDRLEAIARERPDARVLDLGCGGGHVSYRMAPHVSAVVACDLSADMLAATGPSINEASFLISRPRTPSISQTANSAVKAQVDAQRTRMRGPARSESERCDGDWSGASIISTSERFCIL